MPAEKSSEPVAAGTPPAELRCCALMCTVVRAGSGTGVVVASGSGTVDRAHASARAKLAILCLVSYSFSAA